MKRWYFALPLLVFLVMGSYLYAGLKKDPREIPSPLIGKPAPDFTLPELRPGRGEVTPASLLGKPWLLNVWGSWCVMCRVEHQQLMQLAREKRIVLVGLNWRDQTDDAQRWLARYGDPYDVIAQDSAGRVAIDYGVYGAPETYLIDAQGTIRFKFIGAITPEALRDEILPEIARLQGESR